MSCLHLRNLTVDFATPEGVLRAVDNVDLDHRTGETLSLVGETGCGKSVIALAIMGLLPENATVSGSINFRDRELLAMSERELNTIRGTEIAILLQNPSLALNPLMRISRQIAEPLITHRRVTRTQALRRVHSWLSKLGFRHIERRLDSYPFELSGGMCQRVVTAASLITEPAVLIADEPTTGLDDESKRLVTQELESIRERSNTSLFLITHDLELAAGLSHRIAVMYGGRIVEIVDADGFFKTAKHPYSKALLQSHPRNGFRPIPGPPLDMTSPPRGCRFAPRCTFARHECGQRDPDLKPIPGGSIRCIMF